jgi:hypothetical protein
MRTATLVLVAVGLLATAACQTVTVRGPDDKKLAATTPLAMTLHRGESKALEVGIDRDNFSGPVTVSVSQLPPGVEVDRNDQKVETQSATFALTASANAELVAGQPIGVTVEGMDGRRATQFVALTVKH